MRNFKILLVLAQTLLFLPLALAQPQSVPGPDSPELAALGEYAVGTRNMNFVQPNQPMLILGETDPVIKDRTLRVRLWYPAQEAGDPITYITALPGADNEDTPFEVPGIATVDAEVHDGNFPLIILAHGFSNTPEVMAWLGENIASKGYVVVAPAFRDPPINIRTAESAAIPLSRRPLDINFIARAAQLRAKANQGIFASVDPEQTALIGYSMGGYGVLTSAGAPLKPEIADKTKGVMAPFVAGGDRAGELIVPSLKAVIAIAPPGGNDRHRNWQAPGVGAIKVPTLYIAGERDHVVGYNPGVRTLFESQTDAPRYLLTFLGAAHSIALMGAPENMRDTFYDIEWFEDSVWRKDRLLPIQNHFITAFLDTHLKSDADKASYIDGLIPNSGDGVWEDAPGGRYAGYSPGAPDSTIWKGFQPSKANGMMFEYLPPCGAVGSNNTKNDTKQENTQGNWK